MRIGLAQMDIAWENIEKNEEKVLAFFKEAAAQKVELLVFPEMTFTGFSMNAEAFVHRADEELSFMKKMSLDFDMAVVFGYMEAVEAAGEKTCHNVLSFVDRGEEKLHYAKLHPFTFGREGEVVSGGDEVACLKWHDNTIGAFICYDLRFPEIFQISSKRAELILLIANWPEGRIGQWDTLLSARAIENQCYVAAVNRSGDGDGLHYTGHSAVYDAWGERMTEITEDERLIVCDVDTSVILGLREGFPVKKDRREEIYEKEAVIYSCS